MISGCYTTFHQIHFHLNKSYRKFVYMFERFYGHWTSLWACLSYDVLIMKCFRSPAINFCWSLHTQVLILKPFFWFKSFWFLLPSVPRFYVLIPSTHLDIKHFFRRVDAVFTVPIFYKIIVGTLFRTHTHSVPYIFI